MRTLALYALIAATLTGCGGGGGNGDTGSTTTPPATTPSSDSTPEQFEFTERYNGGMGQHIESNTITVSGIDTETTASITDGELKVNDGDWTTEAPINNGDSITVRVMTPETYFILDEEGNPQDATTEATLDIEGVTDTFIVYSGQKADHNITPYSVEIDPATDVTPGANVRFEMTLTGLTVDEAAWVYIMDGQVAINGTEFTSEIVEAKNGDDITFQVTATDEYGATENVHFKIGDTFGTLEYSTIEEVDAPQDVTVAFNCEGYQYSYCDHLENTKVLIWEDGGDEVTEELSMPEGASQIEFKTPVGGIVNFTVIIDESYTSGSRDVEATALYSYVSVSGGTYYPRGAGNPALPEQNCRTLSVDINSDGIPLGDLSLQTETSSLDNDALTSLNTQINTDTALVEFETCSGDTLTITSEEETSSPTELTNVQYAFVDISDAEDGDHLTASLTLAHEISFTSDVAMTSVYLHSDVPDYYGAPQRDDKAVGSAITSTELSDIPYANESDFVVAFKRASAISDSTSYIRTDVPESGLVDVTYPDMHLELHYGDGYFDKNIILFELENMTPDYVISDFYLYADDREIRHEIYSPFMSEGTDVESARIPATHTEYFPDGFYLMGTVTAIDQENIESIEDYRAYMGDIDYESGNAYGAYDYFSVNETDLGPASPEQPAGR